MHIDTAHPSEQTATPLGGFTLSESARKRIAHLLKDEPEGTVLRIAVMGGGCSGFQYQFEFEPYVATGTDTALLQDGAYVVIDAASMEFLRGAELDYVESLGSASFEIKNPNSTSSCGCGNSFSIV